MNVFLLHRDRDFDLKADLPPHAADLIQDLELNMLWGAMAGGDPFLLEVCRKVVLKSLDDLQEIRHRQSILMDCLEHSNIIRQMYDISVEAGEREKRVWGGIFGRYPDGLLHRSIEVLRMFVGLFRKLRRIVDEHSARFQSEGMKRLFEMIATELSDDYLVLVEEHLQRLEFRNGLVLSAQLGKGNIGVNYILRKTEQAAPSWTNRLQTWIEEWVPFSKSSRYVYEIADRDEAGFQALSELRGRGMSHVAVALAQSVDHILGFFRALQLELAFYIGCLNLRDQLVRKNEPICFPETLPAGEATLSFRQLYDVGLSLTTKDRVVGNEIVADGKSLLMITGANRGGKSTFLRSIGLSQLMMQCGLFVPAESFRGNVCDRIFTHFKRGEDASMKSGKLDEELARMSSIVDNLTPNSMILLNESFASTNEREGSEIARQIIRAFLESSIKVVYVTHLFDLAQGFYMAEMDVALFLRAERFAGGQRSFRLVESGPLPTSYGEDLYRRIFGALHDSVQAIPSRT